MALNASGKISIGGLTTGESINLEIGRTATATTNINETTLRNLAGIPTGQISFSDFYTKTFNPDTWGLELTGIGGGFNYGAAVDSSGNVYATGLIWSNSGDAVLVKYNQYGVRQWERQFSGFGADYLLGIAVGSTGNVYFCGNQNSQGSGGFDAILGKYDSAGTLLWQVGLGSSGSDSWQKVAIDSSENVYVTGWTTNYDTNGDLLLAKYNNSGVLQWQVRLYTGAAYEGGNCLAVDSSANVYVGGSMTVSGANYGLIVKYNTSGNVQWTRSYGDGTGNDIRDIAVDSSANVYAVTRKQGSNLASLVKYDTWGTAQWHQFAAPSTAEEKIAVDSSGNVYIAGSTLSGGATVIKYNSAGTQQWARTTGSTKAMVARGGYLYLFGNGSSSIRIMKIADTGPTGTWGSFSFTSTTYGAIGSTFSFSNPVMTNAVTTLTAASTTLTSTSINIGATRTIIA